MSDLHLNGAGSRSGSSVRTDTSRASRVEIQWRSLVGPDDWVLMPGDLSLARKHRDLQVDLEWLHRLPGRKVISPGNHDAWWNRTAQVRRMMRGSIRAICGDATEIDGAIVAAARGVPVPRPGENSADTLRLVEREYDQLQRALADARARRSPGQSLIVLWHFPPYDLQGRPGPWVELMQRARVDVCLYGHLHGQLQWAATVGGIHEGILYRCVAADAIGDRPLAIALPTVS